LRKNTTPVDAVDLGAHRAGDGPHRQHANAISAMREPRYRDGSLVTRLGAFLVA
jgi:hypothetical protein